MLRTENTAIQFRNFVCFFLSLDLIHLNIVGVWRLLLNLITLNDTHTHIHTLGRTPLDEVSARHRDLYLTTHKTHKRQTSRSKAGFEPAIPASSRRPKP
jgi:hypothetical protein